ncbi:2-isopropylmalate synthase [Desulfohalotomaculum tongense]|uniref:citramalate synthase n=1 Tax=Desulforadius tongensis TaxID=1216062 RepID=UPI0019563E8E|nr:citramalate synthase [Desulforadius tongensis]MBM7853891.1 2-isopropylmalate synthase [Desulforadius tongensis]
MAAVKIYDTTLRDGTQGEGISLSVEDKIKIALKLDAMGFHYIEGGWPGSNPKDMEFFRKISRYNLTHATITAFGCTRKPGTAVERDVNLNAILQSGVKAAAIFGKSWDFHVTQALNTTLEENLAMIEQSVAYLKKHGLEVIYDAEHFFDGYKANREYALATVEAAQRGGADTVVLCDTNGGTMPCEVQEIIADVKTRIHRPLGIHAHNDCELAVANSMVAVRAGAAQVQGTVNGYGERCGNANLCSIIPNLAFKYNVTSIPRENLVHLTEMSRYVSEVANVNPNPHQPYVGASAFAHKGGIHVSALLKEASTYEHIQPEQVGNKRRVLVSELSGVSNLFYKYKEMNVNADAQKPAARRLLEEIKQLENKGYQFEAAEGSFELLMRKAFNGYREPFSLESMRIIMELKENQPVHSEAVIKMKVKDNVVHTAAEGNGPVNALDNALRKALEEVYPAVKKMKLNDYKVRVLDEKAGTESVVRVLIETGDGKRSWSTVGVSTNIIEASWQALVDSMAYGLLKAEE